MCGIYGWIGDVAQDPGLHHGCLAHRGPDGAGEFRDVIGGDRPVRVAFGHRRLSIIDLSPQAAQPMTSPRGSAVTYNGEIYNYRELRSDLERAGVRCRSASDTEVLLRGWEQWGPAVLPRLNGMFAFGLWDRADETLVLARDRAGIKPLFYTRLPGGLVFASEIKALLRTPGVSAHLDPVALAHYFTLGYVPGERTVYRHVRKLPAAHVLTWRRGEVGVRRYWQPPPGPPPAAPAEGYAARLADVLRAAVHRQLVADVPLGAFLSGGLDSSLVVALMRERVSGSLRTFTVGFEEMQLYDERPHAREVARRFHTEHVEELVRPRPRDDVARIVAAFDEPFADSSAIPTYYLAATTRRHVAVALSGTGADDLFGGYRRYAAGGLQRFLALAPTPARRAVAWAAGHLPSGRHSRAAQAALYLQRATAAALLRPEDWYASLVTLLDRDVLAQVAPSLPVAEHPLEALLSAARSRPGADRYLWVDFHTYLPDELLVKEDRMTMTHGLEARVPFLDNDVIDFAWTLPPSLKVRGLTTKVLLKDVARRWLPDHIVQRRKHGFALPVAEWLRRDLREMAEAALFDAPDPVLNPRALRSLWDRHQAGRDLAAPLWAVLVYRLWERGGHDVALGETGAARATSRVGAGAGR